MSKDKKRDMRPPIKTDAKKKEPDSYNSLMSAVEKSNPEFVEWIRSKTRKKAPNG